MNYYERKEKIFNLLKNFPKELLTELLKDIFNEYKNQLSYILPEDITLCCSNCNTLLENFTIEGNEINVGLCKKCKEDLTIDLENYVTEILEKLK